MECVTGGPALGDPLAAPWVKPLAPVARRAPPELSKPAPVLGFQTFPGAPLEASGEVWGNFVA